MDFTLTDHQAKKLKKWIKIQDEKVATRQGKPFPYYGAIGGAYTISFTPSSIGTFVQAQNSVTQEKIDLTEDL